MSNKLPKLAAGVTAVAVTLVLIVVSGCGKKKTQTAESIANIQKREGVPVKILVAQRDTIRAIEIAGGTAEGYYQTTLKAALSGRLTAVNVKVGDRVGANSSLMRIEPDMPQNYGLAQQQYQNAQKSRDRIKTLADEGGVSQELLDQVETGYLAAKEGLSAARKNEFVLAPFAGVVVGIFETKNSTVGSGTPLVEIATLEKIRIPMTISDVLINKFKPGQSALAIAGTDTVVGKIEKVSLAGQAASHSFTVEAVFENSSGAIKPAMYLPVLVVVEEKNDIVKLPMETVIAEGSAQYVFAVRGGVAVRVPVETGIRGGSEYEIRSGIEAGDSIVTSGSSQLADGSKVKIVQ